MFPVTEVEGYDTEKRSPGVESDAKIVLSAGVEAFTDW